MKVVTMMKNGLVVDKGGFSKETKFSLCSKAFE
jgi:hypothetical protein